MATRTPRTHCPAGQRRGTPTAPPRLLQQADADAKERAERLAKARAEAEKDRLEAEAKAKAKAEAEAKAKAKAAPELPPGTIDKGVRGLK